jgi:hypothetical protein
MEIDIQALARGGCNRSIWRLNTEAWVNHTTAPNAVMEGL